MGSVGGCGGGVGLGGGGLGGGGGGERGGGVNGHLMLKGCCGGACKNLFHKRKNLNNRKLDAIWHSNLWFISCLAISLSLHPNWQCITLL